MRLNLLAVRWMVAGIILLGIGQTARAQMGPCATPTGPLLPDLTVSKTALRADAAITEEFYDTNSCEVIESCISTSGTRRLIRFTTTTPNIGKTALVIGSPVDCDLLFHFSECHMHYHFEQYADYRLWTPLGYKLWKKHRLKTEDSHSPTNELLMATLVSSGDLFAGRKQGFCMVDSAPNKSSHNAPPAVFEDCINNQGISAGWSDIYESTLPCQFLDITGAPAGRYILEVEVNPYRALPESNYRNNSSWIPIKVPAPTPP